MAFFCVVMLDMALELSLFDATYQDMASKFFEHFIMIADAMNAAGNGEGNKKTCNCFVLFFVVFFFCDSVAKAYFLPIVFVFLGRRSVNPRKSCSNCS